MAAISNAAAKAVVKLICDSILMSLQNVYMHVTQKPAKADGFIITFSFIEQLCYWQMFTVVDYVL